MTVEGLRFWWGRGSWKAENKILNSMSRMAAKWYSLQLFKLGFLFYVCWIQLLGVFDLV